MGILHPRNEVTQTSPSDLERGVWHHADHAKAWNPVFDIHFSSAREPVSPRDVTLSGEGGIRTHGSPKTTTVFETAPFNHSGTSPGRRPRLYTRQGDRSTG